MDTHEIPHGYGYSGDPQKGLVALGDAEVLVLGLPDTDDRKKVISRIEKERSLIERYLARLSDSKRHL